MNKSEFINFITGNMPNSKPVQISEFCNIVENNLWIQNDQYIYFRHLFWSIKFEYRKLLNTFSDNQLQVIVFYFTELDYKTL